MVHLWVRLGTIFAKKSSSHGSLHSWQPPMSYICSAGGGCDENRTSLVPISVAVAVTATAVKTATEGNLELPKCSDPNLEGYWAWDKTCFHQLLTASRISPSSQVLAHHHH